MEHVKTMIKLPGSFLASLNVREDELGDFIIQSLAVELYREGELSLGKAAEIAGLNKGDMLNLLNAKGVPLNYTALDALKDLETVKEVLGR